MFLVSFLGMNRLDWLLILFVLISSLLDVREQFKNKIRALSDPNKNKVDLQLW